MEGLSKANEERLNNGETLADYTVSRLRAKNSTDALKKNASNALDKIKAGKAVTSCELREAMAYYPDETHSFVDGGKVKEKEVIGEWASVYAIAKHIGVSQQSMRQMIKRNPLDAPEPNCVGRYNVQELAQWYKQRSYSNGKESKDTRQQILEQEYRLKKVKADREEELVIDKSVVVAILTDADILLEALIKDMAKEIFPNDREKQEWWIERGKKHFENWRAFLQALHRPQLDSQ